MAWKILKMLPELTDALLKLSCAPSDIPEDAMHIIERFVILLYDRTATCTDIDKARCKLFANKSEADSTNQGSTTTFEESSLSGWSHCE